MKGCSSLFINKHISYDHTPIPILSWYMYIQITKYFCRNKTKCFVPMSIVNKSPLWCAGGLRSPSSLCICLDRPYNFFVQHIRITAITGIATTPTMMMKKYVPLLPNISGPATSLGWSGITGTGWGCSHGGKLLPVSPLVVAPQFAVCERHPENQRSI